MQNTGFKRDLVRERGKIDVTDSYSFKNGRVSRNRQNTGTWEKVKYSKEVALTHKCPRNKSLAITMIN